MGRTAEAAKPMRSCFTVEVFWDAMRFPDAPALFSGCGCERGVEGERGRPLGMG